MNKVLGAMIALLLAAMVIAVLWQVVSRYLLGAPSAWTEELARYLLVWLTLFGAAYAVGQKRHLAIDLVPGLATPLNRKRLATFSSLMIALFAFAVLVVGGGALTWLVHDLGQRSAALGIPLAIVYLAVPLSGLLTLVYAGLDRFDLRLVSRDRPA
jgi:TRAP-type C4-dicarboxylate transport system permease small subunit